MRKALNLMVLIGLALLCTLTLAEGETMEIKYDESVTEILARLTCPYQLTQINAELAADYESVGTINIALVQTWDIEDGRVELYQGDAGGYLALLVKEGKIFCAQYVNGFCLGDAGEQETIPQNSYYHEAENSRYGVYIRIQSAFYLDGQAVHLIYGRPNAKEPLRCYFDDTDSILSLIE